MRYLLAYFILFAGFTAPSILNGLIIRFWLPVWWRARSVRFSFRLLFVVSAGALLTGILAPILPIDPSRTKLGFVLALIWLPQMAMTLALPVAALCVWFGSRRLDRSEPSGPTFDLRRRRFLQVAPAVLPLGAAGISVAGITATVGGARCEVKPVRLSGLPAALRGLRILQISDLHLGGFMMLEFLAETLAAARTHRPDLVVVTGDLADDYRKLPEALRMLDEFRAPLGTWAVLGNHEYGNGVEEFCSILAASEVQLLVNEGRRIDVGEASIYLAGVDDIVGRNRDFGPIEYLADCVDEALRQREPSDCAILLTHRPNSFPAAAARKVPLTLAGHTHGGQAAWAGHSWLEVAGVEKYAWGFYRQGDSVLYTSAGAGQWVPVRLGCPSEAPVFELA